MKETSAWAERAAKRILQELFNSSYLNFNLAMYPGDVVRLANIIHEEMNNESEST